MTEDKVAVHCLHLTRGSLTSSNNETGGWFSLFTLIHTSQCNERPCRASCGEAADQNTPHKQEYYSISSSSGKSARVKNVLD